MNDEQPQMNEPDSAAEAKVVQPANVAAPKKKLSKALLWGIIGGVIMLVIIVIAVAALVLAGLGRSSQVYTDAYAEAEQLSSAYNKFDGVKTSQIFAKIGGSKLSEANVKTYRESAELVAKHDKALMDLTKDLTDANVKKARAAYIEQRKKDFGKADNAILASVEGDILVTNINGTCIKPFEDELNFLHREGSHRRIIAMLESCELLIKEYGERDDISTPESTKALGQFKMAFSEMKAIAQRNGSKEDFEEGSARVAASITEATKSDKPQVKPDSAEAEEFAFADAIIALRNSLSEKADLSKVDRGGIPAVGVPGIKL